MTDLVGPILEVIKFIGRPAKNYLNYHRKFSKYVDDLKQAQADLRDREADIRQQLQNENRLGKMPRQEVQSWFRKVEEKTNRAQIVEEKVSKGKYLFRSCLGKLVDEMTQEIKGVHHEGLFSGGLVVNDPLATKVNKLPTEELVGSTPAEEIYEYLMGDEFMKIGVWGMGGIGKTTIVKNVCNKVMDETKFNKLIWTTVSQDFDIWRLQKCIALQLNEDLSYDDDATIRAAKLSAMLMKQGRYALILDDVWKRFSLNDIGIPEPDPNNGCKLIITTRREDVIRSMGCKQVQMRRLLEDEALQLFLSKVGHDMLANPTIESTMKSIVKECSGLPLAIVTVAGSMKGIVDSFRWEHALSELQNHIRSIQFSEDEVFGSLKFSYAYLDPKLQPCFLYCALYPEDYEIQKVEIIEHWLEEELLGQMETRKAMHSRGHVFLQKLEESCLLEGVQNSRCIKMHDLVRDMALRITEENHCFFVKAGLQLIELSYQQTLVEDMEKVSFMNNYIKTIPSDLISSKCMKLTTLFLSHNSLEEIPNFFFDHMPNLKVLDLSWNYKIVSLPHSLSNLVNLTTLLLSSCERLRIVPSLAKLVALRKLDLLKTGITEIPQGLEALVNLRYLNLGSTKWLKQIPSGVFLKLVHLQHLVLFPALLREEEIRELKNLEVLASSIDVPSLSMYVRNKNLPNEYEIAVIQDPDSPWDFKRLYDIYSQVNNKAITFAKVDINLEDAISVPSDIGELALYNCGKVRTIGDIGGLKDATNLKSCRVGGCDDLVYLFSTWCAPLQRLEYISLQSLENLERFVAETGPSSPGCFSSLKSIDLFRVNGIKKYFPETSILGDLYNLERLNVAFCDNMEEIIASEEEEQGGFNTNNSVKFTLPKLKRIKLCVLPKLRSICSSNVVMVCNSLNDIAIINCRVLKRIPLYFPSLDNTPPSIPPSLKEFYLDAREEGWWELVECSNPNAKNVLRPVIIFINDCTSPLYQGHSTRLGKKAIICKP